MKAILNHPLLKGPLRAAELFTGAKSFQDNPLIGSPLLNKLGLHVARIVLSHGVMKLRMWLLSRGVSQADRHHYRQYGYIMKENFLSTAHFAALDQEIRNWQQNYPAADTRSMHQGDTETRRTLLDPEALTHLPNAAQFFADRDFQRLVKYANGHRRLPFFNIEQINNGVKQQQPADPQKNLHADTFHPTMKFWLYLDDVDDHNGPFNYIPASNRLSRKRLSWEYHASQQARNNPDRLAARGSFRFSATDRETIGLAPPHAFKVKKNTLLIANTFGVHGRGRADPGSTRLALWGMGRTNPFIPFPGTGLDFFNRYQYEVLKWLKARGF